MDAHKNIDKKENKQNPKIGKFFVYCSCQFLTVKVACIASLSISTLTLLTLLSDISENLG